MIRAGPPRIRKQLTRNNADATRACMIRAGPPRIRKQLTRNNADAARP
jgi:hypothetical protein